MTFKDIIRYILWRMRYRSVIPAAFINRVPIKENGEDLVDIRLNLSLFFSEDLGSGGPVFLRKGAYALLQRAIDALPEGYFFKIYSAYRSIQKQRDLWNQKYNEMKEQYPYLTEEDLERRVRAICADPRRGFGGHQTGGAIDLTLCDSMGHDLDMGGNYFDDSKLHPTFVAGLTHEQQQNRRLLYHTLVEAGFQNYPNEWWHYCYGDRMWAAYQLKRYALYGLVEKDD